ncbi:zincin-like metallopeptidase toxin domain-containing protein [Lysinibacillus xylanilyticus]|uniref:zincin-like metallopeptidase toxin domain-containing protein n=1 Tax=Lysinibacillus xylanilyticus TaxID=582475 RepID=UPI003D00E0ED
MEIEVSIDKFVICTTQGTLKAEQFDFKSWEEMPVSGQIRIATNGQRYISVHELKKFKRETSANNINVVIDKKR